MYREVPLPLVRLSQVILLAGTAAAPILAAPGIIYALFVMVALSYFFGPRLFLPFIIGRPLFGSGLIDAETEAAEQLRFNQSIAVAFLFASSAVLLFTGHWSGYVISSCITVVCILAMFDYCVGCQVYAPVKLFLYRHVAGTRFTWLLRFMEGVGDFTPRFMDVPQPLMIMGLAHVAVRRAMDELETLAKAEGHANFIALVQRALAFVRCMRHHATQEDDFMYPGLEVRFRGVSTHFAGEHEALETSEREMMAALTHGESDARAHAAARSAVERYIREMRNHLTSEETRVQKWMPYKVSVRLGAHIMERVLQVNPDEFCEFHAAYVFSYLKPGQRYVYARMLLQMLKPEEFSRIANVLRPHVSDRHWSDFMYVFSRRRRPRAYEVIGT